MWSLHVHIEMHSRDHAVFLRTWDMEAKLMFSNFSDNMCPISTVTFFLNVILLYIKIHGLKHVIFHITECVRTFNSKVLLQMIVIRDTETARLTYNLRENTRRESARDQHDFYWENYVSVAFIKLDNHTHIRDCAWRLHRYVMDEQFFARVCY